MQFGRRTLFSHTRACGLMLTSGSAAELNSTAPASCPSHVTARGRRGNRRDGGTRARQRECNSLEKATKENGDNSAWMEAWRREWAAEMLQLGGR